MHPPLKTLHTTQHLRELFRSLGYRPCQEETDLGWTIARWQGVSVLAVIDPDPTATARRVAQTLASRPGRFLVAVLAPLSTLAFAAPRIERRGSTAVMTLDLINPAPGGTEFLERLRPPPDCSGLMLALRLDEVLGVEPVGKQFYAAFRLQHHRLMTGLPAHLSDGDRNLLALLPMIRVLFLYFVQAKGWLNNDRGYLRTCLDNALGAAVDFHREVLNPLFFETLNCPVEKRGRSGVPNIPYLNGGLFDPHPLEQSNKIHFTNDQWRDAFDSVFERFRFCIREGDEVDAIAPDMLGHVFERLMAADDRHASGSFYTPEPIVRQLVTVSVNTALAKKAALTVQDLEDVSKLSSPARQRLLNALKKIRVLDPAAGTGAFLMGVLDHLTGLHGVLAGGDGDDVLHSRKQVMQHCIYGVDINPIAVRLAELRLWLAVIADDPTTDTGKVEPLPNFDGVMLQGDSLFDPLAATHAMGGHSSHVPITLVAEAAAERRALFPLSGSTYRRKLKSVRACERKLATILLKRATETTDRRLADLTTASTDRDLFGAKHRLTASQRAAQRRLTHQRDSLRRLTAGDRVEGTPFFSYEIHLADIMQHGGFDVIVGNPPWVRAERLPPAVRATLKYRFQWWGATEGAAAGYTHLPDLSVAFLERAVELCRPGGVVGFLIPSKLLSADYGANARTSLVKETTIQYLHRVPSQQANLFAAATYPLALVTENTAPPPEHKIRLTLTGSSVIPQRHLSRGGPWLLVEDPVRRALKELREAGVSLGFMARPALGLKTGANDVFLIKAHQEPDGRFLVVAQGSRFRVDARWVRPVVRGRDVAPFSVEPTGHILWPCDDSGQAVTPLPKPLRSYFSKHEAQLRARSDLRNEHLWTVFRQTPATSEHRVIWADIARRPRAASLEHVNRDAVPINSCYVCNPASSDQSLVIAAMLNTTWAAALARISADEARGEYRRLNSRVMSQIPIPTQTDLRDLITLSRQAHYGNLPDQTTLDEIAADALGLTHSTRDILSKLGSPSG